jgi:two-component system invasion response regulator UvrY
MRKILIVDDHAIVRRGLKDLLVDLEHGVKIYEAGAGDEAIDQCRRESFDLVLIDFSLPGKNGLETISILRSEQPDLKFIMLSIYPEEQYAMRAMKAGASAYLNKECLPEELMKAVRKVLSGGKYISEALAELMAFEMSGETQEAKHTRLSNRENEVLLKIVAGQSINEIADELFLSAKTISTYKARILEKLELKNSAQLATYAVKNNLVH